MFMWSFSSCAHPKWSNHNLLNFWNLNMNALQGVETVTCYTRYFMHQDRLSHGRKWSYSRYNRKIRDGEVSWYITCKTAAPWHFNLKNWMLNIKNLKILDICHSSLSKCQLPSNRNKVIERYLYLYITRSYIKYDKSLETES